MAVAQYLYKSNKSSSDSTAAIESTGLAGDIREQIHQSFLSQNEAAFNDFVAQMAEETKFLVVLSHDRYDPILERNKQAFLNELEKTNMKAFEEIVKESVDPLVKG